MGEAKFKQYSRARFLLQNPCCAYCGLPATTTDHCPPRCFFADRVWPETYEFPACKRCNDEARLDEQALGVLVRIRPNDTMGTDWERLVDGVRNNQPSVLREWTSVRANQKRHALRKIFGRAEGDRLRHLGFEAANIGPLTTEIVKRFMVKLGKSLFYKYNAAIFDGVMYTYHTSFYLMKDPMEEIESWCRIAPMVSLPKRAGQDLVDQFLYRFNYSPEHRALYAVARFSEQFVFVIMAMTHEMASRLETTHGTLPSFLSKTNCVLPTGSVNLRLQVQA